LSIAYDVAVFTNLTPEHIEAHGGFENYKKAKHILFEHVAAREAKTVNGITIPKIGVFNADSTHSEYFADVSGLDMKLWYSLEKPRGLYADNIVSDASGTRFTLRDEMNPAFRLPMRLNQPGEYNILNALAALAVCKSLGVALEAAAKKLGEIETVPGRFERVDEGQPYQVVVDYAPEPESFRQLYRALKAIPRQRTIHILGSCGGGRDIARRPVLGELAAKNADVVVVTNEDPYDDDPREIIDQVANGAKGAGKIEGENLFLIDDRREAIFRAMSLAKPGDLVVMTGKGCEPWICLANGQKAPWNEAETAR
jgi:UDP-N-acetylmuramoyl-L-alanyl-D-glutamate--2,6-diaminopimelate ligase